MLKNPNKYSSFKDMQLKIVYQSNIQTSKISPKFIFKSYVHDIHAKLELPVWETIQWNLSRNVKLQCEEYYG